MLSAQCPGNVGACVDWFDNGCTQSRLIFRNIRVASAVCTWDHVAKLAVHESNQTLRGERFAAPSNTEKILTALYGWDWAEPDAKKLGGGVNKNEWKGDVCAWPNRPGVD